MAGVALTGDSTRATTTVQIVFIALLFPSSLLIMPYFGSIAAQGFGNASFPLLGVRAAAGGCAGFAAMIGLAVSRPSVVEGLVGIVVGLALIATQLGVNRRAARTS